MANYRIFKDGELINTIVADKAFCALYCDANGYTYELMPEPEPIPEPEVEPDVWDELAEAYKQGVQSAYDE